MKRSNYNVFIPYKSAYIVYNTLWNTSVMLKEDNHLFRLLKDENKEDIRKELLPQSLIDNRMFIDNDINELSFIKETLAATNEKDSNYIITICPTLACNFSCWYCYEQHEGKKCMSEEDVSNVIAFITAVFAKDEVKNVQIGFFGGEPLLGFAKVMKPVVEAATALAKENGKTLILSITTNAFLMTKEVCDYMAEHSLRSAQITLDGNKQRHDVVRHMANGKSSYDTILTNVLYAVSGGIDVTLRLNISEDTNLNVTELLREFSQISDEEKAHLCFSVQKVWQAPKSVNKDVEAICSEIRTKGFNCTSPALSGRTIRNTCYADKKNHVVINPGGLIYGCTARDFDKTTCEGLLKDGHIKFNPLREKHMNCSPLHNKECILCNILPICGGGCKQKMLEANDIEKCFLGYSDEEKHEHAKQILFETLNHQYV